MKFITKLSFTLALATVFSIQFGFAIGDQHGVFRSQSTQGNQWMGTATIEEEEFRITVHPNYLEVELDWVFRVGGDAPEKFSDALEIVGNINLVKNSVVTGMLTWWQGDILKGKLKTAETARADYEEVVQRDADAPPPPRDPVLIEYGWGLDNYDISIFPATFGETRKVRIHYLVPANSIGGKVKVPYPHAFTSDAKVSVKAGPDVASYEIETGVEIVPFANNTFVPLSETDFSFSRYNSSGLARPISYIIPVLPNEGTGSRFYVGDMSGPNLTGQAAHVVVMDAQKIIVQSDMNEDFVILWRWSHVSMLQVFAEQIVRQSELLQTFLAKVSGANKRAAMVIDMEGSNRVSFALSAAGDSEYTKMLAYLDSLSNLPINKPQVVSEPPDYQIQADAAQALEDFEAALAAALALFENNNNIRHLLLLTAGPQIIYDYFPSVSKKLDSSIHFSSLVNYAQGLAVDIPINPDDEIIYWPGINPTNLFSQQTLNLDIQAVVSNGVQLCTLKVLSSANVPNVYGGSQSEVEKHTFTSPDLIPNVSWTISQGGTVISSFLETPQIITVGNSLALSQILGASRALTPMAPQMPRSMAAAVGFIDSTYSLVALEEDKLSAAEASQYALEGVPELLTSDIHANPDDLVALSLFDWLAENPPQTIWNSNNGGFFGDEWLRDVAFDLEGGVPEVTMANAQAGAFMPMPIAGEVGPPAASEYKDYSKEPASIETAKKTQSKTQFAKFNGLALILDLTGLSEELRGELQLEIYDLSGSLVYSNTLKGNNKTNIIEIPTAQFAYRNGLHIIKLNTNFGQLIQKLILSHK